MTLLDGTTLSSLLQQVKLQGKITRTFRRLDPVRQQAVLHAILEDAVDKGPASLNIRRIAARANVSVGSLYQYFTNRDGLLDFAVELCVQYMLGMFSLAGQELGRMSLAEALMAYLTTGIQWGQTEVGLVRFFGRAAYQGDPELTERLVRPVAAAMRLTVFEMLEKAAQRGEIGPEVDREAAARLINGLTIAVGDSQLLPYINVYFQITDDGMPPDRILAALVALITRGLTGPNRGAGSPVPGNQT